jgi:hypothetical protein
MMVRATVGRSTLWKNRRVRTHNLTNTIAVLLYTDKRWSIGRLISAFIVHSAALFIHDYELIKQQRRV